VGRVGLEQSSADRARTHDDAVDGDATSSVELPPPLPAVDFDRAPAKRHGRNRGWLVRRMLVVADLAGLVTSFIAAELVAYAAGWPVDLSREMPLFLATLPLWVIVAKIYSLYDRDEERAHHSTIDEIVGVFHLLTVGVWLLVAGTWLFGVEGKPNHKAIVFWLIAIVVVPVFRAIARAWARRRTSYQQKTIILGAGKIGQLVARKLLQHPEYGIELVGFVDSAPLERREEVRHLPVLGEPDNLATIVAEHDVERVIVAFSADANDAVMSAVRSLTDLNVQVDVVPRLFELVAPNIDIHLLEGLALMGLPPVKPSRSSRWLKRGIDIVGALVGLILTAPLFLYAAWRIRRESPGPVFFRQERLGLRMEPFTMFKFRTMRIDVDQSAHREYIAETMDSSAAPRDNGLYKLDRTDAITPFGRWLRRTSLDELPQLVNVLKGDMSLVGPRPCIAYETEHFKPHHYERFLAKPGLTGLWQVTARAHTTFGEALDMDVAYVRGWSLGLDLTLLGRTPAQLVRQKGTA
jgi:exopolysaccharide biosynthesis polyprenyl glycosylphosphotransferase